MSQLTVSITDEERERLRAHAAHIGATEEQVLQNLIRALSFPAEGLTEHELLPMQPPFIRDLLANFPPVPEEEAQSVPDDLAQQVDHYVYGTPKQ